MQVSRFTGSAGINETINPGGAFRIERVELHLDTASGTSENIVVSIDSGAGAVYDTVIASQDTNTLTDVVLDIGYVYNSGDKIKITYTNTDTRTYGLSVFFSTAVSA